MFFGGVQDGYLYTYRNGEYDVLPQLAESDFAFSIVSGENIFIACQRNLYIINRSKIKFSYFTLDPGFHTLKVGSRYIISRKGLEYGDENGAIRHISISGLCDNGCDFARLTTADYKVDIYSGELSPAISDVQRVLCIYPYTYIDSNNCIRQIGVDKAVECSELTLVPRVKSARKI